MNVKLNITCTVSQEKFKALEEEADELNLSVAQYLVFLHSVADKQIIKTIGGYENGNATKNKEELSKIQDEKNRQRD